MNDNVIQFRIPESKIELNSPEVSELVDQILELTQCDNLFLLQIKDGSIKHLEVEGDVSTIDKLLIHCAGICNIVKRNQEENTED
jgi:hypothetical protein